MVTVTFNKTFTSGSLVGITINESIKHVDGDHAKKWVDGINANIAKGTLPYKIANIKIAA